jgi:hypothetical protein
MVSAFEDHHVVSWRSGQASNLRPANRAPSPQRGEGWDEGAMIQF